MKILALINIKYFRIYIIHVKILYNGKYTYFFERIVLIKYLCDLVYKNERVCISIPIIITTRKRITTPKIIRRLIFLSILLSSSSCFFCSSSAMCYILFSQIDKFYFLDKFISSSFSQYISLFPLQRTLQV
jgi:hypothetical protein